MDASADVLLTVMRETGTSQSGLARLSGVHQPSISQMLSSKIEVSDEQLDRLLSCMGYRLEVVRRAVLVELTQSERRSWLLHRALASHANRGSYDMWRPTILENVARLEATVRGQPHLRCLGRWRAIVEDGDLRALRRALTGLDRTSIEMREVSPMGGLLAPEERHAVLQTV
jgi:hypothetical protein